MRYALVNPPWSFEGSIYFGCREPHLPLEYGYAKALLEQHGHDAEILDGQMDDLSTEEIKQQVRDFRPDVTVVTTAPSYLFWRCAPPELRVPQRLARELRSVSGILVVVGPHASTTPQSTLRKLGADVVILGECEEILPQLADNKWSEIASIGYNSDGDIRVQGSPHASNMTALPPLCWPAQTIHKHRHHHHRFDAPAIAPGAEMEASRGCPYSCTFCAKENFRNKFRKRPLATILAELDGLIAHGTEYVYFIDEIFLPNKELLEAVVERPVKFGIQTRVDLWSHEMLDLAGQAGCVSIEAGVESITPEGREQLDKNCKLSTDELSERLIYAKRRVPFVQANLIAAESDEADQVEAWRQHLQQHGVWANKPVPLFPFPGSPEYTKRWGTPDDRAWERALDYYLHSHDEFSDVQEDRPLPMSALESAV